MKSFIKLIDSINTGVGKATSYLILPMVFVVVYEVILRKVFAAPTVWAFDVTIYIYGIHFILGFGYVLLLDQHVRIDVIYNLLPRTMREWLRVITFIIFFFPFLIGLTYTSYQYSKEAWDILELGQSTWRPPLYIIKTFLPLGAFLLLLQGVANFIKDLSTATGGAK